MGNAVVSEAEMGQETSKILVVDDDMRLRSLLERYLVEQGFQVRSAANAEQMDRLLERENFHLMVLDLMLPGEDGLSICRRMRQAESKMPIIMLYLGLRSPFCYFAFMAEILCGILRLRFNHSFVLLHSGR